MKLNDPQHAKKKALVLKAIKYLERLIIHSNRSLSKQSPPSSTTPNACEAKLKVIKQEPLSTDTPVSINSSIVNPTTTLDETITSLTDDVSREALVSSEGRTNKDPSVDIDPKTYCKLGHFHLLLEDFPKGK